MDGAGAALRDAAAVLGPGQAERVPQHPEQGGVGLDLKIVGLPVDGQRRHLHPPVWSPAPTVVGSGDESKTSGSRTVAAMETKSGPRAGTENSLFLVQ